MEATVSASRQKVDELLEVLDRDIHHVQQNLSWLNELRALLIRRDDAALARLMDKIRLESDSYKTNELRRQSLRKELADIFQCPFEQMTLSRLEAVLPQETVEQVVQKRAQLKPLVDQLKKEHLGTMLLLAECARFNNLLLTSIFELGKTGMLVYGPGGTASRQNDNVFVNFHF
jgi:hypothetical protein